MIKWHINNEFTEFVKECARFNELTEEEHVRLYTEVKNVTLQGISQKIIHLVSSEVKIDNTVNSLLLWVVGATDHKPNGPTKIKSQGSFADFDIDFSKENRDKVSGYLKEKYGEDRTANVVTFSTLAAKAAVRSAQRALGKPIETGNKIAKNIPDVPGISLSDAIENSKILKSIIESKDNSDEKEILQIAMQLEGLPQALGVHACAFIISDKKLTSYMPEMIATKKDNGQIITQYEYYDVEALGCLKFDLLGLKTLDVIKETVDLIKERHNINVDIANIDVNDSGIYKLLEDCHVAGIFQFDGSAANFLPKVKPQNINEISDLTSLLRPGPLSMGMLDQYAEAKFSGKKYTYGLSDKNLIQKVWDICSTSYGLLVYQEQVIKCFTEIGGFNEIEGDNARRAMGKKKAEEMAALRNKFIDGGKKNYNADDIGRLFDQIAGFAEYGFNKSHAICYSVITAQTAWLSHYYPLEFYTVLLTIDSGNTNDVRRYITAIKRRGIGISAPSINNSDVGFSIKNDSILFGMSGIKGVGSSISSKILKRKPKSGYKSFGHFIMKNIDILNKKVLEQYAKAGAFRDFNVNKASALRSVDKILDFLDVQKSISEYYSIFDICEKINMQELLDVCYVEKVNKEDLLEYEIETLGLYITRHPLEDLLLSTTEKNFTEIDKICSSNVDHPVITVGCICNIEVRKTKSKTNMASFDVTSPTSSIKCIVFPSKYSDLQSMLTEGKTVVVNGIVREENDNINIIVNDIKDNYLSYFGRIIKKETSVKRINTVDKIPDINSILLHDNLKVKINDLFHIILERH